MFYQLLTFMLALSVNTVYFRLSKYISMLTNSFFMLKNTI